MTVQHYIDEVHKHYKSGKATEHTYRGALQECLEDILPKDVHVTNEPKRQQCGAPDYILTRRKIDVGYIEAKEVGKDLDKVEKGSKDDDQWQRYTQSLENIILTDYLEFRFFTNGTKNETIKIAEIRDGKIIALPENFSRFETLLKDFAAFQGQTIKSSRKLAEMMAHKASLMRDVFFKVVTAEEPSTLKEQLAAFKEVLMHDMDEAQFADVYAQTVAYGLFTARLHDKTLHDFSRGEALTLIPKTNPFLQKLFQYVAGSDIDSRVIWIVDALCEVYRATDLNVILKDFGSATGRNDPILHFYETFLAEYDPKLRKARGVWYTPEPVVSFIVRAVDDVLKDHFGLKDGLADTAKVTVEVDGHAKGKTVKVKEQVHRVQLLDVATGTGTFLAEVVKQIYNKPQFKGQQGTWGDYVEKDLLPRMHGFELLIASYAMCHMKLDLLLRETGYDSSKSSRRLSVYLTNSLEEHHKDSHLPFANWLSTEANEASRIKRDMPIMIAMGNPPYSGHSENKGEWIMSLMEAYKKEPGGKGKLNERNPKWLNDDYVKFIRLGEHYIEKNGEGVLAYITNHSYLDNPTFRGMRWHLLETFDDIYLLDLHGNAKKKETAPDGKADKNVFDIMQGVSIVIAMKKSFDGKKKPLANVHHADIWGDRIKKYEELEKGTLKSIKFKKVQMVEPQYLFIPRNTDLLDEYKNGIDIDILFQVNGVGMTTARDKFVISSDEKQLIHNAQIFSSSALSNSELCKELNIPEKNGWDITRSRNLLKNEKNLQQFITNITYRPFDNLKIFYHDALVWRTVRKVMGHFLPEDNVGLIVGRQGQVVGSMEWNLVYVTNNILDFNCFYRGGGLLMPLYTYEKMGALEEKRPNLDPKIYAAIKKTVPKVTPESLFDYIYAVLHSPAYRKRYAEFLKSDFPRIPYPKDAKTFDALAKLGGSIRALHLLESPVLEKPVTSYPVGGDHAVDKPRWEDTDKKAGLGRVFINDAQYFDRVPKTAWEFYIGGYQPAQKWLKDRKGRTLSTDDIRHWQKIIVALSETDRLMKEIDEVDFLP